MKSSLLISLLLLCKCAATYAQERPIDKEFLDAVQHKDIPTITSVLSKGANINTKENINGHFALQYAIDWPDVSLVKLLIDKGADVNLADNMGYTALTDAMRDSQAEYTEIVKLLIAHGANIHAHNDVAIFGAVKEASPEVVRLLLSKGAPVNARDPDADHDTVLMNAVSGGSVETVELLLAAGAQITSTNKNGETALMKAVRADHRYSPAVRVPIIELLLKKGADVNAKDNLGRTPLLHSVVQYMSEAGGVISHPEIVKLLLDRGANVHVADANGDTALITTVGVWHGPIEIVRLLIASGVDVNGQNKKGTTALMVAAEKGKDDQIALLIGAGADLALTDSEGATALDYAIENGQTEIAKSLFKKLTKSRQNYKSENEMLADATNSALLRAAINSDLTQVKAQLALGANIKSRTRTGETALMLAIAYGYGRNEVIDFLIEHGVDLDACDANGNTALMIATEHNDSDAAIALLAHKVAVYSKNKEGRTVLHMAAAGLHRKVIEALLATQPIVSVSSTGADVQGLEVNGRDATGRTPLMLAADNEGFVPDDVMELLLNKGAEIDAQDPEGNTALIISTKNANFSGVEFLVNKGAAVNLKNKAGETALIVARRIHEQRIDQAKFIEDMIVTMLLKAGAKE